MSVALDAEKFYSDDKYFAKNLITIQDRNSQSQYFTYNPAQDLLNQNLTGRDLVVKAGQLGITTYFLARAFKRALTHPGFTNVIVAHTEDLTKRLLSKVNYIYNQFPEVIELQMPDGSVIPTEKPIMKKDSEYLKSFEFPSLKINSVFYIGTARSYNFGRGEPINTFHGSEIAFWPDPEHILLPTLQRVPINSGEVYLESTPNGEGGYFYDTVQECLEGNSLWTLHQLNWWLEPEYRLPIGHKLASPLDQARITNFTVEELSLIKKSLWDDNEADERIRWRRRKIREAKRGFFQEFMEDIVSCFISSGSSYYDGEQLDRMRTTCHEAPFRGVHNSEVWHMPKNQHTTDEEEEIEKSLNNETPYYHIGVDPGQGKNSLSVATVWRIFLQSNGDLAIRHEATLRGLYDPPTFAAMVKKLGYFYHTARIAAERNGHGLAFVTHLDDYSNVYWSMDIISGIESRVIGWKTTGTAKLDGGGSKPYMMTQLNALLPNIECNDIEIIRQLSNVRLAPDNKIIFISDDDSHDSTAIMAATLPPDIGRTTPAFQFAKVR